MNKIKILNNRIRGWFPQEPELAYAVKAAKPRWRRPAWIAVTLVGVIALAFVAYTGVQTAIRYSNPQADVTAAYFEKSVNCTSANVGDIVKVDFLVGWHGYILPEFERQVQVIDAYPQDNYALADGNNTYQTAGYGTSDQHTYCLRVISRNLSQIDLPSPKLLLDGAEIKLTQTSGLLTEAMQTTP